MANAIVAIAEIASYLALWQLYDEKWGSRNKTRKTRR